MRVMGLMLNIHLYFKYSVSGGGAWKSPPTKSFLTKVGLSSVGSNWNSCNSTTVFATANDVREGKNECAYWLLGEHWKWGLEKSPLSSDVLSLEWPLKPGSKCICFLIKWGHSRKSSIQSWSEMDMREENYFILHPFSALFLYLHGVKEGPVGISEKTQQF